MNIDEELISREFSTDEENNDEPESDYSSASERAGEFNKNKRAARDKEMIFDENDGAGSLNEAKQKAKALQAYGKNKLADKASVITNSVNQVTSNALKQSWLNLITSFGATILWINAHVFLRYSFGGGLFCRLGEEWTAKNPILDGNKDKSLNRFPGLLEAMALGFLDLLLLVLIIGVLFIFSFIPYLIDNPGTVFTIFTKWPSTILLYYSFLLTQIGL